MKKIQPQVFYDFRGEFVCTFNIDEYQFRDQDGQPISFVEDDIAVSRYSVIRGMHGDDKTWKLIHCSYGDVYCVIADMRQNSTSYLKWEAFTLNDRNRLQLLVPAGCATGIQCMSDTCVLSYKQSQTYHGAINQVTLRWNDPKLGIYWPVEPQIVSFRDRNTLLIP